MFWKISPGGLQALAEFQIFVPKAGWESEGARFLLWGREFLLKLSAENPKYTVLIFL